MWIIYFFMQFFFNYTCKQHTILLFDSICAFNWAMMMQATINNRLLTNTYKRNGRVSSKKPLDVMVKQHKCRSQITHKHNERRTDKSPGRGLLLQGSKNISSYHKAKFFVRFFYHRMKFMYLPKLHSWKMFSKSAPSRSTLLFVSRSNSCICF
jgi:hypothetical protein